jgi:hypothetical protein
VSTDLVINWVKDWIGWLSCSSWASTCSLRFDAREVKYWLNLLAIMRLDRLGQGRGVFQRARGYGQARAQVSSRLHVIRCGQWCGYFCTWCEFNDRHFVASQDFDYICRSQCTQSHYNIECFLLTVQPFSVLSLINTVLCVIQSLWHAVLNARLVVCRLKHTNSVFC